MPSAPPDDVARTVLVIDDEPVVLHVVRRSLSRVGWRVLEAETAEEALGLLSGSATPDLVICDLNLPGQSGADLCLRIVERYPALASRLILMSGDAAAAARELERAALDCPILGKPFSLADLARVVESVAPRA